MAENKENKLDELNAKSCEIMADIFAPLSELMKDKEFAKLYVTNIQNAFIYAFKNHPKETVQIAAALEGQNPDEYIVNPFRVPLIIWSAFGMYSKVGRDLFISQAQNSEEASSGSATENIEASEQPKDS